MKKSNHTVGECYKTLNTHDPHEQYQWVEDSVPWWVPVLYGVAFIVSFAGIFGLVFLGMLL